MADNTRVNELQDKLLKAMDILNAQALNSISFDKTITCKIENDKDKKDGKYEVNDGNRIFTAYSTDTRLRAGDTVYVTVPEGNFENQKMIIGKKTKENDKPFNFIQPFDTFFDMTGNFVNQQGELGLVANDIEDTNALMKDCRTSIMLVGTKTLDGIKMVDVSDKDIIKYSRMAIRADFKTWIKNAVRGEYGINVYLRTSKPDISKKDNKFGDYKYNWNNSMMYGNPYNFETYYSQEVVLDLEKQDIGQVLGIAIEFYQNADFYDKFNEPIFSSENGFLTYATNNLYDKFDINGEKDNGYYQAQGKILQPNLFVNNLELYFGKDISTFTSDMVEIYTSNSDSYKRSTSANLDVAQKEIEANKKEIKIRWVHLKDGMPIDMNIEKNQKDIQYEIRWYRYSVGAAAADEYCGVYWKRIDDVIGFNYIFNPDVNKQQEKIKVIIIYKDGNIPYRSNELIFENEEQLPPSQEAQHIMTALNIECDDGTNGNYLIYGQNRDIKDTKYGDEERTLSLWFDADNNGQYTDNERVQYNANENIIWTFPANNTMIKLLNSGNNKTEIKDIDGNVISYILSNEIPKYQIIKSYNTSQNNNTISCQYTLNNVVYNTEKVLTFGIAGTMGSEQTLVVDFLNDTNAIDLNNKSIQTYQIKVQLYDTSGQEITDLNNITWSWWKKTHDYLTLSNINSSICNLQVNHNNIAHGQLYILKIEVGNLETYFSIPLKSSDRCDYIEGPTEVIYQSNGEPDFYNYPYKIYNDGVEVKENIEWGIISTDINNINPGNYDATIQNKKLNPIKVYVKDAPFYGVKGGYNIGKNNEQIYWTQPIIVMQNKWPSNVINKWDGKTIEIDNGNGTILTQALAAGTKNSNNEFSGVMIGEWKHTDSDQKSFDQTGIFGFHEGAMSYAFKEDGTAFIGKDGKGRIHINGDNATIYSQTYTDTKHGIKIDLNEPYLVISQNNGEAENKIDYPTSNYPFQIGSNFRVEWNGTIYATNGDFTGTISASTLQSGKGGITLNGYFQIPTTEDGSECYFGSINSGIPGKYSNDEKAGIGMSAGKEYGVVKATRINAGLGFDDSYVSVKGDSVTMGINKGSQIVAKLNSAFFQLQGSYFILEDSAKYTSMGAIVSKPVIYTDIPATNQFGIYARFA